MKQITEGTVKWFCSNKGFGFIVAEGQAEDIFFHISEYRSEEPVQDGDKVSFYLGVGKENKPAAKHVRHVRHAKIEKNKKVFRIDQNSRGKPYHGKFTKIKDKWVVGRGFIGGFIGLVIGFILGEKIWIVLAYIFGVLGAIVGAVILASIDGSSKITETCLKCGGTGKVTTLNKDHIGFQCENCKSHWKKKNKEGITIDDLES